jgi:hypothetical protein
VREQRYIRARLDLWEQLTEEERGRVKDQIRSIARGVERFALEACVLRGVSPSTAAQIYRLNKGTIYRLMREFLEGFEIC